MILTFEMKDSLAGTRARLAKALELREESGQTCSSAVLLDAIEATGYWTQFGLPAQTLRDLWHDVHDTWIAGRLMDVIETASQTIARTEDAFTERQWEVEGLTAPMSSSWTDFVRDVLAERMRAAALVLGTEWLCEQSESTQETQSRSSRQSVSRDHADDPLSDLYRDVYRFDRLLQKYRWALAVVARTDTLEAMRACIPASKTLPWWLSGVLDEIAIAYGMPDADRLKTILEPHTDQEIRPAERRYRAEYFTRELVRGLDGRGVPRNMPTTFVITQDGKCPAYDWWLARDSICSRVRLIAPPEGLTKRRLTLAIAETDEPTEQRTSLGRSARQDDPESRVTDLVGKMMFLNGLNMRWTKSSRHGGAHATILAKTAPPLPESGQLVLVDCLTSKSLEPASFG
jgi:hypothetical protein